MFSDEHLKRLQTNLNANKPIDTLLLLHPAGTSVISALFEGFYNGGL